MPLRHAHVTSVSLSEHCADSTSDFMKFRRLYASHSRDIIISLLRQVNIVYVITPSSPRHHHLSPYREPHLADQKCRHHHLLEDGADTIPPHRLARTIPSRPRPKLPLRDPILSALRPPFTARKINPNELYYKCTGAPSGRSRDSRTVNTPLEKITVVFPSFSIFLYLTIRK